MGNLAIFSDPITLRDGPAHWHPPARRELLRWPLPGHDLRDRLLLRGLSLLAQRQVISIGGLNHIDPRHDPLIIAINHSTRNEAIFVPALLMLHRGGQRIRFLADWNFRLIPGIGFIYRRAETITVTRKDAKPRLLNVLRPLYRSPVSALEQARRALMARQSVGLFPEASVNRAPDRLLPGRRGAAYLSLATRTSVVPVGIRFPLSPPGQPIVDTAAMAVSIGAPLIPPASRAQPVLGDILDWHAIIMTEIARLSGKSWRHPCGATACRDTAMSPPAASSINPVAITS